MKYRGIFEYEYPTEHKPPISIDVHLHGDCVKGKIIEWEYRPLEQEPNAWSLDDAREDFMHDVYNTLDFLPTNEEANRIIDSFDRVTSNIKQEPILDKIRAEIESKCDRINSLASILPYTAHREIQELLCEIIDLCKAESEVEDGND
jgi:hypothetical protein